ncbi:MAG: EAL domain-containing protein [Campylobacterales bacterium]|nr:EAL domain-containing protein [Campylobacterales bacterium]
MKIVTLKSILSATTVSLTSHKLVSDALGLMEKHGISSIVIVDHDHCPVGIFTERDALRIVSEMLDITTSLHAVMTPNPFCVVESMHLHDAYRVMEEKGFRHLIVVDEVGCFRGVVSEGDFLRHMGFEDLTKFKIVSEAMSNSLLIVETTMSLVDAATLMSERKCDYAVVMEGSHPVGMITERDIAGRCAHIGALCDETVAQLLQVNIHFIHKGIPLHEAASLMEVHSVHQLVVVDSHGNLVGLLTRHDVLHAVHGAYFEFLLRVIDQKSAAIDKMTERKEELTNEKKAVEKNELKLRKLLEALPDGMALVDSSTMKAVEFNHIIHERLGYTAQEFAELTISDYEMIETPEETYRRGDEIAHKGRDSFETIHRAKDGTLFNVWINVVAIELDGRPHLIAVYRDIGERKRHEEQLEALANYDPLTGLANRTFFSSHLHHSIEKAKRHKGQIGLLMFDLDRFKDINDSFGHGAGDELLQQVAQRFETRLREGDIISRLGGDEFGVLLDHLSHPEEAGRIAKEMIDVVSAPYTLISSAQVHVGTSVGIVLFPDHGDNASELLQHADAALYKAKGEGRGTYRYYSDELTDSARRRIECETQLRRAVAHHEFEVYYQPQVHIATGRIIGAEALIRWNDPVRGLISPVEFIPLAEETGLIGVIGEWVLNETCRQGKIWLDQGHRLTLAVNLSAHQVRHQNIPEMVKNALGATGYPADKLELEITESALMQREEETVAMLHILRALGIRLAIDDFGTGYSSLSYLKRFPIDVLKIDKSFVDDLPFDTDDMAIVTAIIAMGKALGFQILAEGTENIEQIDFLKEKGCTMYQGYYKSRPVPAAEFEKLL